MIIDTHLHAWLLSSEDYPWHPLSNVAPDYEWPIEASIDALDRHGIDAGVLIQPSMYAFDHSYVVSCARRYPDRLRLVGMVDPRSPTVETEVQKLANLGFRGLRLAPMLRPDLPWYNSAQADRLWQAAAATNLILGLLLAPHQMAEAVKAIERFPSVTVVVDHLARPDQIGGHIPEALLASARLTQVYVKLSALGFMSQLPYPHADAQEWIRSIFDAFGPDRLVWGTDTPMSQDPERVSAALDLLDLALPRVSSTDRTKILGGTATRLFGWSPVSRGKDGRSVSG